MVILAMCGLVYSLWMRLFATSSRTMTSRTLTLLPSLPSAKASGSHFLQKAEIFPYASTRLAVHTSLSS